MIKTWPLMVGFKGTAADTQGVRHLQRSLERGLIQGVILFAHNLPSHQETLALTSALKKVDTPTPPLIALDQEGGRVQRLSLKNGFSDFMSAEKIAQQLSPEEAYTYYLQMAGEVGDAGFNYVFGPVVDLKSDVCPVIGQLERAYSDDPEKIADFAGAFIKAHHACGILTSLKHFPGHGLATGDTHQGLVDVTQTFQERELLPFNTLIQRGLADSIMVAHTLNHHWDHDPASLCKHTLQKVLRQQLGYKGVIITDDLHMGAIGQHYDLKTLLLKATQAGNDLLLFSSNPLAAGGVENFNPSKSLADHIANLIHQFIEEGLLTPQDLQNAQDRLRIFKEDLQSHAAKITVRKDVKL